MTFWWEVRRDLIRTEHHQGLPQADPSPQALCQVEGVTWRPGCVSPVGKTREGHPVLDAGWRVSLLGVSPAHVDATPLGGAGLGGA